MRLGLVSDSLGGPGFEAMPAEPARMGVEVNTGGWSTAPRFERAAMKGSAGAFEDRAPEIIAPDANRNPLRPADPARAACLRDTIRIAGEMAITTVCTMSGLSAGNAADTAPNRVASSWPPATRDILRFRRDEVRQPFRAGVAALAGERGVERVALELRSNQCICNLSSLLKLRRRPGPSPGPVQTPRVFSGCGPIRWPRRLFWATRFIISMTGTLFRMRRCKPRRAFGKTAASSTFRRAAGAASPPAALHGEECWRRFCYHPRMAGHDGWLSIEREDVLSNASEGLEKSVALLTGVMPGGPSGHAPQAI